MAIDPEPGKLNLDAPVFADELSPAEFHAALRNLAFNLRWRKPPLPSIGDVLRRRENAKQGAK